MKSVFFDTWAWIALMNKKDEHHEEAVNFYEEFQREGGIPVTTDYVMAEAFSGLRKALPMEVATRFGQAFFKNVEKGKIRFEFIDEERFSDAWGLYEKYQDKKEISFFDFSSMAIMEELDMKEVFTRDKDFERVGMGFILVPHIGDFALV